MRDYVPLKAGIGFLSSWETEKMPDVTMGMEMSVAELPERHSSSIFYHKIFLIMNIVT